MKFRLFSKPQPRPPYVIALEISQFDIVGFSSYYSVPPFPPIPAFSRFVKDWDDEEELLTAVRSLSTTDYINDPYHKYLGDVLEYIHALREYTGEGGICPAKPPIAEDLPKGLNEIGCSPSPTPVFNDYSRDLMDDTCPVCYEYFKDENETMHYENRSETMIKVDVQRDLIEGASVPGCHLKFPDSIALLSFSLCLNVISTGLVRLLVLKLSDSFEYLLFK
ncbi:uncharacterized protein [Solanum lycopersicum]|uniref:uncharacterized protein isoform X1 n=1 Tax=Solanum lycopersicum TaxID=4081 RepID=UPI000532CE07|nr:uncharacterized protein LOC101268026 isoform X1 [Solanum lycopersicum]